MGGGKGGSKNTTTQIKLDPRIETAGAEAAAAGLRAAAMPYTANKGVTIAGFSPQQLAAFKGADEAASAFGLPSVLGGAPGSPTGGYLPPTQDAGNGMQGYSTADVLEHNIRVSTDPQYRNAVHALLASYARSANKVSPTGSSATRDIETLDPFGLGEKYKALGGGSGGGSTANAFDTRNTILAKMLEMQRLANSGGGDTPGGGTPDSYGGAGGYGGLY